MDLSNLFSTVIENPLPEDVFIRGTIPDWLRGSYYKVANGKFDLGNFTMTHAFDGYSLICQFKIEDKRIKFRSRYLNSTAYKKALTAGKPLHTEFGTRSYPDPSKGLFARLISSVVPGDLTDNDAINVIPYNGKLYALSETCFMHQIDISSLQSAEKVDLSKIGVNLTSSHFLEGENGALFNLGISFLGGLKYHIYTFPECMEMKEALPAKEIKSFDTASSSNNSSNNSSTSDKNSIASSTIYNTAYTKSTSNGTDEGDNDPLKNAKIVATIPSSWKTAFSFMHSFGMTENYFIIIEQPLLVSSVKLLATQVQGKAFKDCMDWSPEEKTRFTLIDRRTGTVHKTRYISEPFFFFHIVNSYEIGGCVIIDINASTTPAIIDWLCLNSVRKNEGGSMMDLPTLVRFVLPVVNIKDLRIGEELIKIKSTKTGAVKIREDWVQVTGEALSAPGIEMPRINSNYMGKKYRYIYASGMYYDGPFRQCVCKIDIEAGDHNLKMWKEQDSDFFGEPIFIANPTGSNEDDGVVLVTMTNSKKRKNFLIILDAEIFTEIARAEFASDIPVGNHGTFVFNVA